MENKIKGDEYEFYICSHLNKSGTYKNAYLWKYVPEQLLYEAGFITDYNEHRLKRKHDRDIKNPLQDIGVHIVVHARNNQFILVQCKNYTGTVHLNDLGGFFGMLLVHKSKTGILYYTSKISSKVLEICSNSKNLQAVRKPMQKRKLKQVK